MNQKDQLFNREAFICELLQENDDVIAELAGVDIAEVRLRESEGTLGDLIGQAYDDKDIEALVNYLYDQELNFDFGPDLDNYSLIAKVDASQKLSIGHWSDSAPDWGSVEVVKTLEIHVSQVIGDQGFIVDVSDLDNDRAILNRVRRAIASFEAGEDPTTEGAANVNHAIAKLYELSADHFMYFILKAAQHGEPLDELFPHCSIFEDVVHETIANWIEEAEIMLQTNPQAAGYLEKMIFAELKEGNYLQRLSVKGFLESVLDLMETTKPLDPKELSLYKIIEKAAWQIIKLEAKETNVSCPCCNHSAPLHRWEAVSEGIDLINVVIQGQETSSWIKCPECMDSNIRVNAILEENPFLQNAILLQLTNTAKEEVAVC